MSTSITNISCKKELFSIFSNIQRKGKKDLINWMCTNGFCESPASTQYHNVYRGGLWDHCNRVKCIYEELLRYCHVKMQKTSITIVSWLHDICKVGLYENNGGCIYTKNKDHPKGHGALSIEIIEKFMHLTPLEKYIIKFHMSYFYSKEFNPDYGEYSIKELEKAQCDPRVLLFYFADHMSVIEEKGDK